MARVGRCTFDSFFTDTLEEMIDSNFSIFSTTTCAAQEDQGDPNFSALFRAAMYRRIAQPQDEETGGRCSVGRR